MKAKRKAEFPPCLMDAILAKKTAGYNAYQCRKMAQRFERWTRQMRAAADVLEVLPVHLN
jgi:hypothetical protein